MSATLLIFALLGASVSLSNAECVIKDNKIECTGLKDGDLPGAVEAFSGRFDILSFYGNTDLTILKANSFPGLSFEVVYVDGNQNLETIEQNFLQDGESATKEMQINNNSKLKNFPFHNIEKFTNLWFFKIYISAIEVIPGDISWPSTLTTIEMRYNDKVKLIEPFAFSSAANLEQVWIGEVAADCLVKSNGFRISAPTTSPWNPELILYPSNGFIRLEANAFGNVDGGQLWRQLNLGPSDFNEDALRLLIKAHFDKGHNNFMTCSVTGATLESCDNCDHAWLYKDAQMFGDIAYMMLVFDCNAVCPDIGWMLAVDVDEDFVDQMNSCPCETYFCPIDHGTNYCEDAAPNQATIADPDDCHCFYHCDQSNVQGDKECCDAGLAFNPDLLVCDWAFNIENCD